MITASHNPKEYNGLKFCLAGAKPVGEESGLGEIRALTEKGDEILGSGNGSGPPARRPRRLRRPRRSDSPTSEVMRPLTVAVDTANGMGGLVVPAVMERLPVTLHHLYPELDGTFPNHPAGSDRPRQPARPEAHRARRRGRRRDGVRWRRGPGLPGRRARRGRQRVDPDRARGGGDAGARAGRKVVHNLICSWTVPEVIREHGGVPVRTRVGHSFIKQVMAETGRSSAASTRATTTSATTTVPTPG